MLCLICPVAEACSKNFRGQPANAIKRLRVLAEESVGEQRHGVADLYVVISKCFHKVEDVANRILIRYRLLTIPQVNIPQVINQSNYFRICFLGRKHCEGTVCGSHSGQDHVFVSQSEDTFRPLLPFILRPSPRLEIYEWQEQAMNFTIYLSTPATITPAFPTICANRC